MKKLFVLIVLIAGIVWGAEAQSKEITFEQTKEWKKVLKKAKKEKKLIFIDCYTSWCGPCKMLSSQVFTREDVGNQFNADFVNVKYDMEKDADGVMLKDKFEVPIILGHNLVIRQSIQIFSSNSPLLLLHVSRG